MLTTGPDLWVKKDLVGGNLLPGELITFSLAFGNDAPGSHPVVGIAGQCRADRHAAGRA